MKGTRLPKRYAIEFYTRRLTDDDKKKLLVIAVEYVSPVCARLGHWLTKLATDPEAERFEYPVLYLDSWSREDLAHSMMCCSAAARSFKNTRIRDLFNALLHRICTRAAAHL